jgi:hypothetical protein
MQNCYHIKGSFTHPISKGIIKATTAVASEKTPFLDCDLGGKDIKSHVSMRLKCLSFSC